MDFPHLLGTLRGGLGIPDSTAETISLLTAYSAAYSAVKEKQKTVSNEFVMDRDCPSEHCWFCTGEACKLCGAGCWDSAPRPSPGRPLCEHDVTERHTDAVAISRSDRFSSAATETELVEAALSLDNAKLTSALRQAQQRLGEMENLRDQLAQQKTLTARQLPCDRGTSWAHRTDPRSQGGRRGSCAGCQRSSARSLFPGSIVRTRRSP